MEVHPHEGGHPGQQSRNLLQVLPGLLHPVRPSMVHQKDAAGGAQKAWLETGFQQDVVKSITMYQQQASAAPPVKMFKLVDLVTSLLVFLPHL